MLEEHDEFGWCQCGRNIHQQMQMILVCFHLINCHIVLVADIVAPLLDVVAREGRMEIDKDVLGYTYMGHPSHVKESMRLTNRRKPELLADEEQHRAIGKLLGYDQDAIEEFVGRMKSKDRLRDDLE